MKVLIHALGVSMGGAVRHMTNFLPKLGEFATDDEYVIILPEQAPAFELPKHVTIRRYSKPAGAAKRVAFDNVVVPRLARRGGFDVVVSLLNFGPVHCPVPHVLFQRNPVYYCDFFLETLDSPTNRLPIWGRRKLCEAMMRRATRIVTPSDAMRKMILHRCSGIARRRFRTLYHGFSPDTYREPLDAHLREQLETSDLRMVYPTHAAKHKGWELLFDMVRLLEQRRSDFQLFLTVGPDPEPERYHTLRQQVGERNMEERVTFLGRIPQKQMGELYETADLMVYPSLCESFGFSMIEAMSHGLPIGASDTWVNREMCQDAALYHSPRDPEEGARVIERLFDPEVRRKLADHGRRRASSFDWGWDRYVREFHAIVKEAANTH